MSLLGQSSCRDRAGRSRSHDHHVTEIRGCQELLRSLIVGGLVDELYARNVAFFISRHSLAVRNPPHQTDH